MKNRTGVATVQVSGVHVADAHPETVVDLAAQPATVRANLVYAMHVGGLLALSDQDFRQALSDASVLYADGAAVVLLARAAGAKNIRRAPTTDIGVPMIQRLAQRLGRAPRIALVGGPPGLASRAAAALKREVSIEVVLTNDGYFEDDERLLERLQCAKPDMVLVGMGMPREAIWTHQHRMRLPAAIVVTCGGWFGFLAGEETRAPRLVRRVGLEWAFRLGQNFRRLRGRYARGALVTVGLLPRQLGQRFGLTSASSRRTLKK